MRWLQALKNYERAMATLGRTLTFAATRPLRELEKLGLFQTFELTHERSWLLLKDFLVDQGVSGISGSIDTVRQAVGRELLAPGTGSTWMAMIRSRNLTSHTYNPALAEEIAQLIATQYGMELQGLQQELRRRAEQSR